MKPTRVVILLLVLLIPFTGYSQRRSRAQKKVSKTPTNTASLPLVFTLEADVVPRFSPDGRYIATRKDEINGNKTITKLWDAVSGQPLFSLDRRFLGFSSDGRFMIVDDGLPPLVELREIPSNRMVRSWKGPGFSTNSKLIIVAWSWDNTGGKHFRLSEMVTGNLLDTIDGEFLNVYGDGQYLAFETFNRDRILLWDAANKRSLRFVEGEFAGFSRDDRLIATKTKTLVRIYETATGQLLSSVDCWGEASFSPDGQVIATEVYDYKRNAKDSITKLWETKTGRLLATLDGSFVTLSNEPFSPNGQIIAISTADGKNTKLWDATSGKLLNVLEGGFGEFSPDGQLLTTAITGFKTKVYKSGNAQLIAQLDGSPIGFSPDGQLIMSGTNLFTPGMQVKVWRVGSTPPTENGAVSSKSSSSEATSSAIGPKAIWNPPDVVWQRMYDECNQQNGGSTFVDCVASFMQQTGASTQAIEFTKLMKGEGCMASFREMGKVDFATVYLPFRNTYRDSTMVLINGTPQMIDLNELEEFEKIDIRNDPLYPALARKFPKIALMGFSEGVETLQRLSNGGQRFIIKYALLNGCYACAVAGYAHVAFDFDETGNFRGTRLLRLSGAEPARRQPRRTR